MQPSEDERFKLEAEYVDKKEKLIAQWAPLSITGADDAAWRKATDFPAAFVFTLKLDRGPWPEWREVFEQEYSVHIHSMKRRARLVHDRVELIVGETDSLQGHVDFVKTVVSSTNSRLEHHLRQNLLPQLDRQRREALNQHDSLKGLRQQTKDLRI